MIRQASLTPVTPGMAQMVKNPPATQETWVWSLGREDPLEEGMATHYSILAWRIPWTEEVGRLQFMGSQRIGHKLVTEHTQIYNQSLLRKASPKGVTFGRVPLSVE